MDSIFETVPDFTQKATGIDAYTDFTSVVQEETITFFVSIRGVSINNPEPFTIEIAREEDTLVPITTLSGQSYEQPTNSDPAVNGCGWQPTINWTVASPDPSEPYKSGVYRATVTSGSASMYFWFIVKSANPGINTKILYAASVNTWQAYNPFDGYDGNGNLIRKNLYEGPPDRSYQNRARHVSFNRPLSYTGFDYFEIHFIQWFYKAKRNNKFADPNIELEFCTSIDIHENPNNFVINYKLILSVGHDEYWSWEMRDTIESFISNPAINGNVAFFSGNVAWWQVRLDPSPDNGAQDRQITCFKEIQQPDGSYSPGEDPYLNSPPPQNKHTTTNWFDVLPDRPENQMTGVSYYWGTALLGTYDTSYEIRLYKHWLLKDANITFGHTFGANLFSGMFETDAGDFADNDRGFPIPTGKNAYGFAAPKDLMIISTADLSHLGDNYQTNFGYWCGPNYHNGWGTMGIFRRRNGGFVFHGSNYNWAASGLSPYVANDNAWNEFCWMTKNVLEILSTDFQPQAFLLDNYSFKTGDLSGWEKTGNGTASISQPGHTGSGYCAYVDGTAGETFLTQKYIPIRTNRNYRITCYAKPGIMGVISPKSISIRLQTLDINNKPQQDIIIADYPLDGTDWQQIQAAGMLSIQANFDYMLQVWVKLEVQTGQAAYFDDVVVEEM